MTKNSEPLPSLSEFMHGDEALEIFNAYRTNPNVDDHTQIEVIDTEFPWLAEELGGAAVYLARLGDNKARTFKIRGAIVGAEKLLEHSGAMQIASAGNAGRSVALVGKMHDVPTRVVVPMTAPFQKSEGIRQLWQGGLLQVKQEGQNYDEAFAWAKDHPDGYAMLAAFDDPNVIAGAGTIFDEIFDPEDDVDHIVLTAGGGGCAAGTVKRAVEKGSRARFHIVEAEGSNSLSKSVTAGEVTAADAPNQRYKGSAVSEVGRYALAICLAYRDRIEFHTASDASVDDFIDHYEDSRLTAALDNRVPPYEPTSIVPMTKLADIAQRYPNKKIVVLGTGHNDDLRPPLRAKRTSRIAAGMFPK